MVANLQKPSHGMYLSPVQDVCLIADAGCSVLIFEGKEAKSPGPVGILVPHDDLFQHTTRAEMSL